ncbi:hypothetical protein PENSUB_8375 [Penicillium subrubescens]|uniref:Uncharacterized protein n=1 Tax=Penicillium subrubescens TaxID=1316194 RepID=A0A1Q5TH34_9EURO|nr:hypothetical protein PENSUB_8375 [Penicillium subrubescens]
MVYDASQIATVSNNSVNATANVIQDTCWGTPAIVVKNLASGIYNAGPLPQPLVYKNTVWSPIQFIGPNGFFDLNSSTVAPTWQAWDALLTHLSAIPCIRH